jgi:hypothetical protein
MCVYNLTTQFKHDFKKNKTGKLPQWIQKHFSQEHLNLTTDIAIEVTKRFLKAMAQEVSLTTTSTKIEEMDEDDYVTITPTTTSTNTTTTTTTTTSKAGAKRKRNGD